MKKLNLAMDCALRLHVRVIFHERRLQNKEAEEILEWTKKRQGERFIEIDIPLSENIGNVTQSPKGYDKKFLLYFFLYTGRIITSAVVHNTDLVLSIFGYLKFLQKKAEKSVQLRLHAKICNGNYPRLLYQRLLVQTFSA